MEDTSHDWITFHRVRHPSPQGPESHNYIDLSITSCIRVGYDGVTGATPVSDVWAGWCIHGSLADAEIAMSSPKEIFPFLKNSVESWHALLLPYSHHGEVNWRGFVEVGSALRAGPDQGGPLIVFTTAGFDSSGPEEMPRISAFLERASRAQEFLGKAAGNLRTSIFASCDNRDGITFTLWKDESAMLAAAYGAGEHRTQLMHHRVEPQFDRSSFTRARVVRSYGSWDDQNPIAQNPLDDEARS